MRVPVMRLLRALPGFRLVIGLGAALAAPATLAASAGDLPPGGGGSVAQRYVLQEGRLQVEVSAVRPDILRIRSGQDRLPEDASWAVSAEVRQASVPLTVRETPTRVDISTGRLRLVIERPSLAMRVLDAQGNEVVADAAEDSLIFVRKGFRLRLQMPEDAHYFALGDKSGGLDRREKSFTLWNTDAFGFGVAADPLYKAIPFVLGARENGTAFGWFLDNTWRTNFDFGKAERDVLSITAEGGPVDRYVMAGPTPKEVVQQYAALTGKAPLTPQWALGFQQSHYSYMNQGEVLSVASRFRADHVPVDVLYCDIDYQDRNRPFTVNRKTFPDMPGMIAALRQQGIRLVLITDLHVAKAAGEGYAPYDSGSAHDLFVHNPDGSTYSGIVWPGPAVFPDFSRPDARAWWGEQYRGFVDMGVSGFWNDMNEPALFEVRSKTMPLDVVHRIEEPGFAPRPATHAEMHNVFGMLNSRATQEGLRRLAPDARPFVLTRASYAGGHRFAATWTGDNVSTYEHLKLSVPMLVNLGLSGFAYAGDDIGGFAGDQPSAELLTRWIELGAFNPIFRDHYMLDKPAQEVWVNGPEHEAIRRRYIEERYRLMPYLYGLAEENSRTGLPLMRPVFLEYPALLAGGNDFNGSAEQFMLGDDLLVAPAPTLDSPAVYEVRLPGEGWYDYWTGRRLSGRKRAEQPSLERLPVFVRPGAIVPRQPVVQSTAERPAGRLTLAVYPGPDCHGSLYADDGVTYAFQRGAFLRQSFTCTQQGDMVTVTFGARQGTWQPWWTGITLEVHGAGEPVRLDLPDQPGATTRTVALR